MPRVCPRPCGRLATAAVFISVSVIQFIAGVILLKSKYVYLLSGPNFWTATLNFSVGCLLGMSASVWRDTGRSSPKHVVRRNVLASLVFSGIVMNGTTSAMLILGEGNASLSIQLEVDGKYSSSTLASEILAYAYAASVCSPIVCVVISIAFLTGIFFPREQKSAKQPISGTKSILKKRNSYNWVYKPEQLALPEPDPGSLSAAITSMSYASSSNDDSFSSTEFPVRSHSVLSKEHFGKFRRGQRIRTQSDGSTKRKFPCDECTPETISLSRNRVSFASETSLQDKRFRNNSQFSFAEHPRRFKTNYPRLDKFEFQKERISSLSHTEFRDGCQSLDKLKFQPRRKRMLLREHPVFSGYEEPNHDESAKNLSEMSVFSKLSSAPPLKNEERVEHKRTSFTVKADVHGDPRNKDYDQMPRRVLPDDSTLSYDADISFDVFESANEDFCHKNPKLRRTSTTKCLNSSEELSSPSLADLNISQHDSRQSDFKIQDGASLHSKGSKLYERSMSKVRESFGDLRNVKEWEHSKSDSVLDVIDESFDTTKPNRFSGEMIPVRVNSSHPARKLSSKLIPVAIPVIGDITKIYDRNTVSNSKVKEVSDENPLFGSRNKFQSVRDVNFSSFRSGEKIKKEASNRRNEARNGELEAKILRNIEGFDISVVAAVSKGSAETSFLSSKAETSGYISSLDENSPLSVSQNFKSSVPSIANPSTSIEGNSHDYNAPQKKSEDANPTKSEGPSTSKWEATEFNVIIDQAQQQISQNDLEVSSQREISEMMKDLAFLRVLQQTLRNQPKT